MWWGFIKVLFVYCEAFKIHSEAVLLLQGEQGPLGGDKTEHCFRINVLIMTGMHFGAVCRRQLFLRAYPTNKKTM